MSDKFELKEDTNFYEKGKAGCFFVVRQLNC